MTEPAVTYLTLDPVAEGVGTSQVARYVTALADRGVDVRLHSFEHGEPPIELGDSLAAAGVRWTPHPFGAPGPRGGLTRLARAATLVRGAGLVHARSDLAAAAASTRRGPWIWDMRAFFADQRIALGTLAAGGPEDRVLRRLERRSARRASAIITLAEAAVPVVAARHGEAAGARCEVITTCVDLDRFARRPPPAGPPTFLLAGTLNAYYDVPLMAALVERARARGAARLRIATPGPSPWDDLLAGADERGSVRPDEMPDAVAGCHVGLSVCRSDAGVSLTAAMPTKLGEFLATGRPVVVNPGLGDMDGIVAEHGCGVVLADHAGIDAALDALEGLLADPDTSARCRAAAEAHFSLDRAVDRLVELYRRLA